jgi:outer membrane protein
MHQSRPRNIRRKSILTSAKECLNVNKLTFALAAAASCAVLSMTPNAALAQAKPAPAVKEDTSNLPHKVALIDMAHIFKNYTKFDSLREDLKSEITENEGKARAMTEKMQSVAKTMQSFKEGSDEFSVQERNLAKMQAEFETFKRAAQRDLFKKESQIYHTVYKEVTDLVEKYANHKGYSLVMRFSRDELDSAENPQALIQGMNRQVVYYRPSDDITEVILEVLNKNYKPSGAAAKPAAGGGAPKPTGGAPDRTAKGDTGTKPR